MLIFYCWWTGHKAADLVSFSNMVFQRILRQCKATTEIVSFVKTRNKELFRFEKRHTRLNNKLIRLKPTRQTPSGESSATDKIFSWISCFADSCKWHTPSRGKRVYVFFVFIDDDFFLLPLLLISEPKWITSHVDISAVWQYLVITWKLCFPELELVRNPAVFSHVARWNNCSPRKANARIVCGKTQHHQQELHI